MTITEYLLELLELLHLPKRARGRILGEVEDHLLCAAAELHGSGLEADAAEREAVRRFGSPDELARSFVSAHAARIGARLAHLALILAALVAWVSASARADGSVPFPLALLGFVLAQVAVVSGGLTWVRAMSSRKGRRAAPGGPELVLRGVAVVVGCAVAAGLIVLARIILTGPPVPGETAGAAGMAALLGACAFASARCRRLITPPSGTGPVQLTDRGTEGLGSRDFAEGDLVLLTADNAARWLQRHAPRLALWLDLRAYPWHFAFVVAAGAGIALAAAHGVGEGLPSEHHLLGGLAAGAIIASIETAVTLLGFAALGRPLGLRSSTRPRARAAQPACGTPGP